MVQLMPKNCKDMQIMPDYDKEIIVTPESLTPNRWIS